VGDPEDCVMDGAARACDRWGRRKKAGSSAPHIHPTNEDLFVGTPLTPQMMNHLRGPEPLR